MAALAKRGDELIGHGHSNTSRQSELNETAERALLDQCRVEVNDIPMVIGRQMDGKTFSELITDQFEEMLMQSHSQPLVMGIALHPYIVGQPHRLRHPRRALGHIAKARDGKQIWITTPGAISRHAEKVASS